MKWQDRDFIVEWNFHKQTYFVYYKGKLFTKVFRFRDVRNFIKGV